MQANVIKLYIYLNNYILSKINLYFCFYIWGFAPAVRAFGNPTSFVATGEARLRREAKRLYLNLNVINYFTCKTILVLFSTNFILALFETLAKPAERKRREKEQQKIDKVKNFLVYPKILFYNVYIQK